jgi:outer membrane protein OmpA-like peptidoglycan-associated protein
MRRYSLLAGLISALALAGLASGCVSGSKIRADAEVVKRDISKAREWRAYDCAPRDLALAETNVEFTEAELSQGNWLRASEHVEVAIAAVKRALDNSKECKPKKVLIKEPPKVAVITKADRDGDGIPDMEDKCPDNPGPAEHEGCPDTDMDGIFDNVDKCRTDAEDKDGFEDEDGCPDFDNDQDGIPDYPQPEDKCPNEPGLPENQGCPVQDRDKDGIPDAQDKCPDKPGPAEHEGCPDTDGDGIFDNVDKCPDVAEDKDGFEDEDGCPDPDNDKDGIPDYPEAEDKCPNEPGPPDSAEGKGCPRKYKLVKINRDKKQIEIKQKVYFQTAKWRILPRSFKLLSDVAQVLKDFPTMHVSIEGHTDSQGGDSYNQRLSEQRANSVREHLVENGVSADRLQSIGFGESKPIASNRTARGREANRRVEFRIVSE